MTREACPDGTHSVSWVLATLSATEAERFAEHLETCATCRREVVELQRVADALAESPAAGPPPADLRERLMAVVASETALSRAADAVGREHATPAGAAARRRRPARRTRGPAALAAVACLALALAVVLLVDGDDGRPSEPRTVLGSVTDEAGGPTARAAVVLSGDDGELVLTDVAGPPEGRVYQAWVVRPPAAPLPTGALFSVPRTGDTRIRLPPLRGVARVIVTAEPPRGSPTPTLPPLVLVPLRR